MHLHWKVSLDEYSILQILSILIKHLHFLQLHWNRYCWYFIDTYTFQTVPLWNGLFNAAILSALQYFESSKVIYREFLLWPSCRCITTEFEYWSSSLYIVCYCCWVGSTPQQNQSNIFCVKGFILWTEWRVENSLRD